MDDTSFKYLAQPWSVRKAIWTFLFVGGLAMSANDTYKAILTYIQKPVNTFNTLRYPSETIFPNLILCNSNQFRITETQDDLYEMITDAFDNIDNHDSFNITKYAPNIELAANRTGWEAFNYRKRAAHKIQDMMIKCQTWSGENCSANFSTVIYDYGVCYEFNGSQWRFVTQPGSGQSLTIFLNLESYEHMQGPAQFLDSLKVTVVHKDVFPYVTAKGFDIVPGYMSMISLKYKEFKRVLMQDGGTCTEKKEQEHFSKEQYSADTCQLNMGFAKVESKCQCTPYYATRKAGARFCNIYEHFNCVIWEDLSVTNGASRCNETCLTIEYSISLSQSKISPSIWPTLVNDDQEKKLKEIFNKSQEAVSRHDKTQVDKLNNFLNKLRNASSNLEKLNMEPPLGDNFSKDAKEPFDKTYAPQCYFEIKQRYQWLFDELQDKALVDAICPFDGSNPTPESAMDLQEFQKQTIKNFLVKEQSNAWTRCHMGDAFSTKETLNETQNLYLNKLDDALKLVKDLAGIFAAPWCLTEPNALADYWKIEALSDEYSQRNRTLKEWIDVHPTGLGNQYQTNYVSDFIGSIRAIRNRIAAAIKNQDSSAFVNRTEFWNYFGYYLYSLYHIVNASLCDNTTQADGIPKCSAFPFYSLKTFYFESLECAKGDLDNKLHEFRVALADGALYYKDSMDNLDDFLMTFGNRWEFGNDFFENNIVGLKVFFADLGQEIVTDEAAFDLSAMFAAIGGSIGLFVGASVLTIFEFLDMLFFEMPCLRRIRNKCVQRRKVSVIQKKSDAVFLGKHENNVVKASRTESNDSSHQRSAVIWIH